MGSSRGNDKIARLVVLEDPPHGLYVIPSVPPVTFCIQIAEGYFFLQAQLDPGRDFVLFPGNVFQNSVRVLQHLF
jgi:hypothetical protein